ncbi:MAG TPA: hypothetical protein VNL77_16825 [Roseiflexaceae bacterium]|nr:hypothetical protein [Roseiflexaceae bacterium]
MQHTAPADLPPRECAALLLACAFYRRHAPPGALVTLHDTLEERLWAAFPPALREATWNAIEERI